jgi:hypothetical protein
MVNFLWFLPLFLANTPIQAYAYIGPGMGLGAAATVLGLFVAFILLLVGLICTAQYISYLPCLETSNS